MQDFQGKVQQVSLSGFHKRTIFRKKWGLTERRGSQLLSPATIKGYYNIVSQLCPVVSISSQIVKPAAPAAKAIRLIQSKTPVAIIYTLAAVVNVQSLLREHL